MQKKVGAALGYKLATAQSAMDDYDQRPAVSAIEKCGPGQDCEQIKFY